MTSPGQAYVKRGFKDLPHLGRLQSPAVLICAPVADWHRRAPSGRYTCKNLAGPLCSQGSKRASLKGSPSFLIPLSFRVDRFPFIIFPFFSPHNSSR